MPMLFIIFLFALATVASAQERKPAPTEIKAIQNCVGNAIDDIDEAIGRCLFKLVAEPCIKARPSELDIANCYLMESEIWDAMLNANYKQLMQTLENEEQRTKLREMQRTWIAYRDTTCEFYWHKIQGSMAVPMGASCRLRETARRALLLKFLAGM